MEFSRFGKILESIPSMSSSQKLLLLDELLIDINFEINGPSLVTIPEETYFPSDLVDPKLDDPGDYPNDEPWDPPDVGDS